MNPNTPKAEELIKHVIIHPPKLAPLLPPVRPATIEATNGVTINPIVRIKDASIVAEEICPYNKNISLLGTLTIGPKNINIIVNGLLVIPLNSKFKFPLIVSDIMTNKKFKPTYASRLNPKAFPSPNLINLLKFVFTI